MALKQFVATNGLETFFQQTLRAKKYGDDLRIPFTRCDVRDYYQGMFAISDSFDHYSYGDFCGLAGDHSIDFVQLYEGLFTQTIFFEVSSNTRFASLRAEIKVALANHYAGIDKNKNQGNYSSRSYLALAWEDASHFQRPTLSFAEMLKSIDPSLLVLVDSFIAVPDNLARTPAEKSIRERLACRLLSLDNASKYALLHLIAGHFVVQAARDFATNNDLAILNFKRALIINAFADHYLQDAFAAGHLPVKRNAQGLDNNGVHDFYCRVGLDVQNQLGAKWKTFGDNYYDEATFDHAVKANAASLQDLWRWFQQAHESMSQSTPLPSLFEQLIDDVDDFDKVKAFPALFLREFTAYAVMPKPLTPKFYEDSIKLKHGSKNGVFYEADYGTSFTPEPLFANHSVGVIIGVGRNLIKPSNLSMYGRSRYGQRSESIVWLGVGLQYGYFIREMNDEQRIGLSFHSSYKDRLAFDHNLGWAIYPGGKNFFYSPSISLEVKYLTSRIAPSVRYYVEVRRASHVAHGVKIGLRIY